MKYNDNGTYKDIYVKSFDTLPVGSEVDYDGQTVPAGWEEVPNSNYILLGEATNENKTITLTNDKLSNYTFICLVSGYFPNKSIITIPTGLFSKSTTRKYRLQVKTYSSYGYVSIQYVSDTQFLLNGAVVEIGSGTGTDVPSEVFGIY